MYYYIALHKTRFLDWSNFKCTRASRNNQEICIYGKKIRQLLTYIKNSLKEIKTHTMFMNIFKAYDNNIVSI